MLSERRDLASAQRFFKQAMVTNGVPNRVVIDKSRANMAGLQAVNTILKITGQCKTVEMLQVRYPNKIIASSSGLRHR
jgi:putative transposase